ncbi:MAG: replication-relaxation family protein [Candidatus Pacebacteria bacterium]|nr:replication-relaxation family protein [Candidatus Paceibacterota bacterium]
MEKKHSPRFSRLATIAPIELTDRDRDIIRLVHRHRFLRSHQIVALVGGSAQQVVRRLQLLFHHGYLERPRAQIQYYERGGSKSIAYGLGNKGGALLRRELGITVDSDSWNERNHAIGRVYLEHALLVSDVMVSLELACRKRGDVRLLYDDEIGLPHERHPFRWWVKIQGGLRLGVMPDRVFALEYKDQRGQARREYFFLEADRGTMPVVRKNLAQTSFHRKLLAYEATWANKVHQRHLGIPRFRVLTVTTSTVRVQSIIEACSQLQRGHGLFLFADQSVLEKDLFSAVWQSGKTGQVTTLLNENVQPQAVAVRSNPNE